jgi:cell division protein FtsQ
VVEVRIVEHRPFARWGKDQLLSEDGDLFPLAGADVPDSLPRFDVDAPAARIADVVALYNEASEMFAPEGVRVREVSLDRRGSWSLLLSNGVRVVVGSQEARLRLARFARLLPSLMAQNPQPLARADLRYTNGFALTWGDEPEAGSQASAGLAGGSAPNRAWRLARLHALAEHAFQQPNGWSSRFTTHGATT